MQVERIIVNFNPVFCLRNRPRGLKRFSCFSRKRTDLSKKKLLGVCTLTKVYQYAKEERFLFFEPCRTLVDICMELLLIPCNVCLYQLFFGFLGEFVILCHYICPPSSCKNCYYYTIFAISVNICRYVLLLFYFYAIDLPKQCLFFFYLKPSIRTITSVFLNSSTDLRRLLVEIKTTTTTFIVKSK